MLSQGSGLVFFTRWEALPCDCKCGLQEVSVEVVKSVASPVHFLSYVTIAEHPAGPSLLDTHGVKVNRKIRTKGRY